MGQTEQEQTEKSRVIFETKYSKIVDKDLKAWLREAIGPSILSDDHSPLGYISYGGDYRLIIPKVYDKDICNDKLLPHAIKFYLALKKCYAEMKDSEVFRVCPNPTKCDNKELLNSSRLEAELALIDFYRVHSDWIRTMVLHHHRGNNVNWSKTISRKQPLISKKGSRHNVIYHQTITNKKVVDYDDQLITIFYSILNLLREEGHNVSSNYNFELIPTSVLKKQYIENQRGTKILKTIKHKYSDNISLKLWGLVHNFFECSNLSKDNGKTSYLLVTNFQSVFEHIVDKLLSDQKVKNDYIAKSMEGRRLDHIWTDKDPVIPGHECYYIADSKYYDQHELWDDKTAIHKQFVYPRNIVENCMMVGDKVSKGRVYDDETRGYFIVPNCIICSASVLGDNHFEESEYKPSRQPNRLDLSSNLRFRYHHKGHLFDRDTRFLIGLDIDLKYLIENYSNDVIYQELGNNVKTKIRHIITDCINKVYKVTNIPFERTRPNSMDGNTSFIHYEGNYWMAEYRSNYILNNIKSSDTCSTITDTWLYRHLLYGVSEPKP